MTGLSTAITRLASWLSRFSAALGGLATGLCLLLICLSVVARYGAGTPLPWIDRTAGWLVMALVLLAAPEAQRRFEHIGVDVLTGRLTGRRRRLAHLLGSLSVVLVSAILLQAGIETVEFSQMIGVMTEIEGVPVWWIQMLLPIGAAGMLVVSIAQSLALALGQEPEYLPDPDDELPRDTLARGE